jgi:hypothetical protein
MNREYHEGQEPPTSSMTCERLAALIGATIFEGIDKKATLPLKVHPTRLTLAG